MSTDGRTEQATHDAGGWQTVESRVAYENPWMFVREDKVIRPNGDDGLYGVVHSRNPAVFIVALTEDDEVVMIETFRYTTQTWSLEVPAGSTDGEDPLIAAERELAEENGLAASEWIPLGGYFALNGIAHCPESAYLARGLTTVDDPTEHQAEEGIRTVRRVPWREVLELVKSGGIQDSGTIAPLMLAAVHLGRVS
ncbi:MAG: NUDIX hydrolase [Nocardioides sp.]|jgi:8-oxo-dGTP pyrophosphatase MutT (NUDIX family)